MRVFDGSERRENLLTRHDGLFGWAGQRHGPILGGVFGQVLLLPGPTGDCANIGEHWRTTASEYPFAAIPLSQT
jgi:hypothetical protein